MDTPKSLLDYLKEEPEQQQWATAGSKKDRGLDSRVVANVSANHASTPQALLAKYYAQGRILPAHVDGRYRFLCFIVAIMLPVNATNKPTLSGCCFASYLDVNASKTSHAEIAALPHLYTKPNRCMFESRVAHQTICLQSCLSYVRPSMCYGSSPHS